MRIVHIFDDRLNPEGGMGRVSYHWLEAFRRAGCETLSLDASNVRPWRHKSLFDLAARRQAKRHLRRDDLLLVHEPLAGTFLGLGVPLILFSHGIEARLAAVARKYGLEKFRLKSLLTWPLWLRRSRAGQCGLRRADLALVLNREDYAYVLTQFSRKPENTFVYRNGVNASPTLPGRGAGQSVLFLGSWIERKGIAVLRAAYQQLRAERMNVSWRLAGTGIGEQQVRDYLGANDDQQVTVIPRFRPEEERALFEGTDVMVLPSYMEGQPLALLQAMEYGLCCVATNADGQKDVIVNEETGLLFERGDAAGFVIQLKRALNTEHLRTKLGASARKSVADRRWSQVADEVVGAVTRRYSHGG